MHFLQNRKSGALGFLVEVLILTVAFVGLIFVIPQFIGRAEGKTAESICRASVALREKSYTEIREPITPAEFKVGSVASPLLCKTIDKFIPEEKDATKEDVERDIAELMASCWREFGEGIIQDPFKQGNQISKNCFVCYTVSLRATSKFNGEIKATELRKFLFDNAHKVDEKNDHCKVNGGFCIDTENVNDCSSKISTNPSYLLIKKNDLTCRKKGKRSCCYTEFECWNRGGACSGENLDVNLYSQYKWNCPTGMKCFVKKENYYSYGDYIQKFGGPGNIIIPTDLKPGETYAISFGSPTGKCGWCTSFGIGTGVATVALALIAGVPTGGLGTVGVLTVSGLFGAGYVVGKGVSESASVTIGELFERDINTIYLTTLNQIQEGNYCTIVKDVRET